MAISPGQVLIDNNFEALVQECAIAAEQGIDSYISSHYQELINDGNIAISEKDFLPKKFLEKGKKIPALLRNSLFPIISNLYFDWTIYWEIDRAEPWVKFTPNAGAEVVIEAPVAPVPPTTVDIGESEIENRSEILDLGDK